MRNWIAATAICLILIGNTGCAPKSVMVRLPEPPRPALPHLKAVELGCLSPTTYRKLVERDRLRQAHAERLEAVIHAANGARER